MAPRFKFFFKVVCMLILMLATIVLILDLNPFYGHDYIANGLRNKLCKLQNTPSPKAILISGSSGAYGVNSLQVERELGIPMINMGTFAGFSLVFMLEYCKPYIDEGDIVLFSREFSVDTDAANFEIRNDYASTVLLHTPARLPIIFSSYKFLKASLAGFIRAVRNAWSDYPKQDNSFYYNDIWVEDNIRTSFMSNVDTLKVGQSKLLLPDSTWTLANELRGFKNFVSSRGGYFFLVPPGAQAGIYKSDNVEEYMSSLSTSTGIDLLNDSKSYFFNQEHASGARWHPNHIGRYWRTKTLIGDLRSAYKDTLKADQISQYPQVINMIQSSDRLDFYGLERHDEKRFSISPPAPRHGNYLRYVYSNKDYEGLYYYLLIKTDSAVAENIALRTFVRQAFDLKDQIDDSTYFFMSKLPPGSTRDNMTIAGITIANEDTMKGHIIEILDQGLFIDPGDIPFFNVDEYQYQQSNQEQFLKKRTLELGEYFKALKGINDKIVVITTRGGPVHRLNEILGSMNELGLLSKSLPMNTRGYIAIVETNGAIWHESSDSNEHHVVLKGNKSLPRVSKMELHSGSNATVKFNNKQLGANASGLNLLVLDAGTYELFDAIDVPLHENAQLKINRTKFKY